MGTCLENKNREFIIQVFKGRCALNPSHSGKHVHEIIPRSRKSDWWQIGNQVLLCPECHDKIHRAGTKQYIDKLVTILWEKIWQLEGFTFQQLIKRFNS